jgi:hypothetical protein
MRARFGSLRPRSMPGRSTNRWVMLAKVTSATASSSDRVQSPEGELRSNARMKPKEDAPAKTASCRRGEGSALHNHRLRDQLILTQSDFAQERSNGVMLVLEPTYLRGQSDLFSPA